MFHSVAPLKLKRVGSSYRQPCLRVCCENSAVLSLQFRDKLICQAVRCPDKIFYKMEATPSCPTQSGLALAIATLGQLPHTEWFGLGHLMHSLQPQPGFHRPSAGPPDWLLPVRIIGLPPCSFICLPFMKANQPKICHGPEQRGTLFKLSVVDAPDIDHPPILTIFAFLANKCYVVW